MTRRPGPHVSDHAVLRYLERALEIDVEGVRRHIARSVADAAAAGASGVLAGDLRFVLVDGVVVTVLQRGWTPAKPERAP